MGLKIDCACSVIDSHIARIIQYKITFFHTLRTSANRIVNLLTQKWYNVCYLNLQRLSKITHNPILFKVVSCQINILKWANIIHILTNWHTWIRRHWMCKGYKDKRTITYLNNFYQLFKLQYIFNVFKNIYHCQFFLSIALAYICICVWTCIYVCGKDTQPTYLFIYINI